MEERRTIHGRFFCTGNQTRVSCTSHFNPTSPTMQPFASIHLSTHLPILVSHLQSEVSPPLHFAVAFSSGGKSLFMHFVLACRRTCPEQCPTYNLRYDYRYILLFFFHLGLTHYSCTHGKNPFFGSIFCCHIVLELIFSESHVTVAFHPSFFAAAQEWRTKHVQRKVG